MELYGAVIHAAAQYCTLTTFNPVTQSLNKRDQKRDCAENEERRKKYKKITKH